MKTTPTPESKKPTLLAPSKPTYPTKDWLAKGNAGELAEIIRLFWSKKGRVVDVSLVTVTGGRAKMGWGVRSDMINGHPVG